MKILLASLSIERDSRFENNPDAPYTIGLAYLHAVLEQNGHEVRLLFLNNFDADVSEETFFKSVEEWQPDLVGFQVFSMNRTSTFAAIERLRRHHARISVVIGGIHTSVMYDQILRRFNHVVAVIGEGEQTIVELARAIAQGSSLDAVNGIAYYRDGIVHTTARRALIEDLDALPVPKHEIFFDNEPDRTVAHIISSRGCPFDCTFCCLKVISQRRYRTRDIRSVVDEIAELKRKYPRLRSVQFHDDTFLLDNARVIEFCKLVIEKRLGLQFICSARVKPISREMFTWMERAGFTKIMFGLETGSAKLLDAIHKRITRDDVRDLFLTLKPFPFHVTTFLMCGFPGETDETVRETIELVQMTQRIHYNWIVGIGKLWVYPGTEVYRIMKESGKIADDFWLTDAPVPYFTVEHDFATLVRFEETMMNHLSFSRILTIQGFIHHFLKMPWTIIRFVAQPRNTVLVLSLFQGPFMRRFPRLHRVLRAAYRKIAG